MSGANGPEPTTYDAAHAAWLEGEYDGYWRQAHRTGKYTNQVWAQYLRGYLAGVKARIEGPTDEELDAWLRKVTRELSDGER